MRPQKRREGTHEVLAKLVAQVGEKAAGDDRLGTSEVASFLSITPGTLYKLLDPDQNGDLSYARVRLLTEHFGVTAAAEDMARAAGGQFDPTIVVHDAEMPWCSKLGAIARQDGILHGMIGEALADGQIDAREAKCIVAEIDAHMEQLRRLRSRVVEEGGQGGSVVRMTGTAR